jgi:hypothetical protein
MITAIGQNPMAPQWRKPAAAIDGGAYRKNQWRFEPPLAFPQWRLNGGMAESTTPNAAMKRNRTVTDDERKKLWTAAGVTPGEVMHDPEHGWLISPSGVRKLLALAPDTAAKFQLQAELLSLGK